MLSEDLKLIIQSKSGYFVDSVAMLIFALYFLITDLLFMVYVCITFSVMSIVGIYFTKGDQ
tara:strand:- start:351 stop:533 length:183 start_codon:yes stop_codon:yes gene_type:complete